MSYIRSVQRVTISIPTTAASATATINPVKTANAYVEYNGVDSNSTTSFSNYTLIGVTLTNSTTVTATVNANSYAQVVYVTIVEYIPGILKSNQSGTVVLSSQTSNTATISAVTTANAVVLHQGRTTSLTSYATETAATVALTNSTTVTATVQGSTGTVVQYFTVLEFNSGILAQSTQPFSIALSTSQTSNTATITSVPLGQTKIFYGGFSTNNTGGSDNWSGNQASFPYAQLTNGTTVTATRGVTATSNCTINGTVVVFPPQILTSVNRGVLTLPASASVKTVTATISAVNTTWTGLGYLGISAGALYSTGNANNVFFPYITLTNSTTITAGCDTAGTETTRTVSWEAIEYAPNTSNMLIAMYL